MIRRGMMKEGRTMDEERSIDELEEEYTLVCTRLMKNLQTISYRMNRVQRSTGDTEDGNDDDDDDDEEYNKQVIDFITNVQLNLLTTVPMYKAQCQDVNQNGQTKFDAYLRDLSDQVYKTDLELMKRIDSYQNIGVSENMEARAQQIREIKFKLQLLHTSGNNQEEDNSIGSNNKDIVLQELVNLLQANCGGFVDDR